MTLSSFHHFKMDLNLGAARPNEPWPQGPEASLGRRDHKVRSKPEQSPGAAE
jgi:hypothetical protein